MNKTETSEKQLKETEISSPPDGLQYNDHKYAQGIWGNIDIKFLNKILEKVPE